MVVQSNFLIAERIFAALGKLDWRRMAKNYQPLSPGRVDFVHKKKKICVSPCGEDKGWLVLYFRAGLSKLTHRPNPAFVLFLYIL